MYQVIIAHFGFFVPFSASSSSDRPAPLPAIEAAVLLQRSDDNVDFRMAWNVLRDMAENEAYRSTVLKYIVSIDYRPGQKVGRFFVPSLTRIASCFST